MTFKIDLPGLVWTQLIENIRVISYGMTGEPGDVLAVLKNVKLIGTVTMDGQVFQVDMEAPEIFCRRQAPCSECGGKTLELDGKFGHVGSCKICQGRGVR